MSKMFVDWEKLNESSNIVVDVVDEFDSIRKNMLDIVNSISEDWQGIDSNNYVANFSSYLSLLEKDIEYLDEWSKYFKKVSISFGNVVNDNLNKLRANNAEFFDDRRVG